MTCELCHRRSATIHIQEVVDGVQKALHLCNECAAERTLSEEALRSFTLADFLTSLAGMADRLAGEDGDRELFPNLRCDACGLTTADFHERGHLGCPACYEAFAPLLETLLDTMHRGTDHVGKCPGGAAPESIEQPVGQDVVDFEVELMQRELREAVNVENYERAAALRDKIQRLRTASGTAS